MQLKTFHADNMKQAMEQIRDEIGEDALIVSNSRGAGGKVSVTVAIDNEIDEIAIEDNDYNKTANNKIANNKVYQIKSEMPDYIIKEIEEILIKSGSSDDVISAMLSEVKRLPAPNDITKDDITKLISKSIANVIATDSLAYDDNNIRIILIGPPGNGKTLTTAKIAAKMVKNGQKIHVITTDYKRAGGVEQLSAFTDILGVNLHTATSRAELKLALSKIPKAENVIIDSAGANPYDFQELKELGEFANLSELTPVLVFSAGGDPSEATEIAQSFSFLGVKHMIITRTDLAKRFGSILSASYGADIAIINATGTEKVLGNFDNVEAKYLANLLMSYR